MSTILQKIKKMPDSPGVYFFRGRTGKILYIGKAGSLRDRIKSYFSRDIETARSEIIHTMVLEAKDITFQKTDSVLEALILEAALIKKYQPKYNSREKDDKSFNYIVITKEEFPRILLVRGRELKAKSYKLKAAFGPFPQAGILREALKIIRRIFPFRDTCTASQQTNKLACPPKPRRRRENVGMSFQKKRGRNKACFNYQIGLCPGVCVGRITKEEYGKTVRNIRLLLSGKKKSLIKKLEQEMKQAARERAFEKAAKLRNAVFSLKHIQDISLIKTSAENLFSNSQEFENRLKRGAGSRLARIEAYDVAHMGGKNMVGAMAVVENGEPNRSEYRKFNIKSVSEANDTAALKEMILRRLEHSEWPLPRLVVVDGGVAQMNVIQRIFKQYGLVIPIVGVVKDEHHRPKKVIGDRKSIRERERAILLANAEAHRFAIAFHRSKRTFK